MNSNSDIPGNTEHPCGTPEAPVHDVDLGELLRLAYEDAGMTIDEDLGLGLCKSTLDKRSHVEEVPSTNNLAQAANAANESMPLNEAVTPPTSGQTSKNRSRALKRRKRATETPPAERLASDQTRREYVQLSDPIPVASTFTTTDMPGLNGAYKARNPGHDSEARVCYKSLEDFKKRHPDFKVIPWNGKDPMPILDSNGKVAGTLCGQPTCNGYREAADEALRAMLKATKDTEFNRKEKTHRRGGFPAVNVGVTYGIGHEEPQFLKTEPHTAMIWNVLNNPGIQRLASYGSSSFQLWQPKVYQYYADRLEKLWRHRPDLTRIFGMRSVYPCAAFNFARNVWCYKHRDVMNCPFGFCSITALGNFDATKGGHLILWEFKMVIEFPHGSTILIPSATITHSNIPVQEGDVRLSFTQFCAGGLFQYIDNGFSTEVEIKEQNPARYKEIQSRKPLNWNKGLDLIATMDDVKLV